MMLYNIYVKKQITQLCEELGYSKAKANFIKSMYFKIDEKLANCKIDLEGILYLISKYTNLRVSEIIGSQKADSVLAKKLYILHSRMTTKKNNIEIGEIISLNRSSVRGVIREFENNMREDKDYQRFLNYLTIINNE